MKNCFNPHVDKTFLIWAMTCQNITIKSINYGSIGVQCANECMHSYQASSGVPIRAKTTKKIKNKTSSRALG